MDNKVHFKTNILLKNIIGKDLITDDNVAVLELVKNSYDAGSKVVEIRFGNVVQNNDFEVDMPDSQSSRIVICDQGCGMDYDGLVNKWLNIAYSEKKENNRLNGRRQAGNKGVGRFSCDRLGKMLTILTKMAGHPCLRLTIDWRMFENEDAQNEEIQDVTFDVQEVTDQEARDIIGWPSFEHGTVLDIGLLRERWTPEKIIRLRRDLEKFIDPNSVFVTDSFQIELFAEEYKGYDQEQKYETQCVNGPVRNKIFEQLDFRTTSISSYIDKDGQFIVTNLQDRGREVFELKEKNIYPHLRNVKMMVYYLNPYSKRYFRQQTGFSSSDFGSIFLFINGFRIPPYGDQGDDWLGIEKRKSLGYRRYLSTREVVGRVEINDEEDDFMIISSRTGVVNNNAFIELSKEGAPYGFFYKGFRRLERFVVEGIAWDKTLEKVSEDGIGEEKYLIDDFSRDKRILSVIRKIIDVDESNIDYLHINEEFVREILDAQMAQTTANLEGVVNELSNLTSNADPEAVEAFKDKLQGDAEEMNKLLTVVGRLAPESTEINRLSRLLTEVEKTKQEAEDKQHLLEYEREARLKAEQEKEELEKRLALEKEKNTYLLTSSRSMSEDAKGMVHNIKIIANSLHAKISLLYKKVRKDRITKDEQLKSLSLMLFQTDKALKISKLITRANFKADSEDKMVDVVAYISQYLDIYSEIMEDANIEIVKNLNGMSFVRKVSVLDFAVIFDNLISNAQKANATKVLVDASKNADKLTLMVSDDGDGLDERFVGMEESIFELGVTSTDGSGIGLNTVRSVLNDMGGNIAYIGSGIIMKGATFKIELS